eukprot:9462333-Pyramimonas_sp.AAC.1
MERLRQRLQRSSAARAYRINGTRPWETNQRVTAGDTPHERRRKAGPSSPTLALSCPRKGTRERPRCRCSVPC